MKRLFLRASALTAILYCPFSPSKAQDKSTVRFLEESLCGPEIVLIGDAWDHARLEADLLLTLVKSGDLVKAPQKTSAIVSHLAFLKNRALMVFGEPREVLLRTIQAISDSAPKWNALALADDRAALSGELAGLHTMLETIAAQIPPEALISSTAAAFLLPPSVPSLQIRPSPGGPAVIGKSGRVTFQLIGAKGEPVEPEALHTTHTEKLHALLLDTRFRDYHHAHPRPTGRPGEYTFDFTPETPGPYRLWLDAMPVASGRGEFPIADLTPIPRPIAKPPAPDTPALLHKTGDFECRLIPGDGGLVFGQENHATLVVNDAAGNPVSRLEPIMGAFAHIVAFADDFQTILHIHPLGTMPRPDDLGGPKIEFRLRPTLPGWLRIYAQFSYAGKLHLASFAAPVTVK